MNRVWSVCLAAGILITGGVLLYSRGAGSGSPLPRDAATARRMWANATDSSDGEHELKALKSSLQQHPDHAPILLRMAQVAQGLGKHDEAVLHLREAVAADPKNRDARLELGRALFDSGDVHGAIQETQRLLELDPLDVDGLYNLGAIYGNLGQYDRAREYWRKAAAVNPDSEGSRRAEAALKQIGG